MTTDLDDELILLDSLNGQMFALGETGRCVWQALDRGIEGAVDALIEAFQVSPDRARADASALIGEMVEAGLVTPSRPLDIDGG